MSSMMNPGKVRVLLAEDHAVVRAGLRSLINSESDMDVVGEASDGRSAYRLVRELEPDIVVMDVTMPGSSGAQATEQIKQDCPEVKVLALTMHQDSGYVRKMLEVGASGYMVKRAAAEELIQAIRVIMSGGIYLDPTLAGKVVGSYVRRPKTVAQAAGASLSERESEVLRLIARGYSNKEISNKLDISVKTVETYKARLMEKLELYSRADLVRYALAEGLLQPE
jgi:DNA-binding NarL/FixJ family response regulator